MGLNNSYEQARNQILMTVPLPTLNRAYSLLIERESQCIMSQTSNSSSSSELNALFTTQSSVPKPRSHTSSSVMIQMHSVITAKEQVTCKLYAINFMVIHLGMNGRRKDLLKIFRDDRIHMLTMQLVKLIILIITRL